MSNLEKHAWLEFRAANWVDDNDKFKDHYQEAICLHVLNLLKVFSEEGHSGFSAPYAVNLFEKLAMFKPLTPLTGEDWEWNELDYGDDMKYQNKRCGHVFKGSDGRAYDSEGVVFYDYYTDEDGKQSKSHYTSRDSRVYIEFPYTPIKEYRYRESEAE